MSSQQQHIPCHVCGGATVEAAPGYERLLRVTSDCKLWPAGGRLRACPTCGVIQKAVDDAWREEINRIYAGYDIYHQSGGVEQAVFDQTSGQASPRSQRLLHMLRQHAELPPRGRLLDIGCGNGAMLRAFSVALPQWSLAGTELNDKYHREVETIPGVERLYAAAPDQVPGQFDLISMLHVLEHVKDPVAFLVSLRGKLIPEGRLLIQLPSHRENPLDLLIADHASHFTLESLAGVARRAGYEVALATDQWVAKELTLLATPSVSQAPEPPASEQVLQPVRSRVAWLQAVSATAEQLAAAGPIGIFGTSIGGTWLAGQLRERVAFFVDEDPARIGRRYLDRPVLTPADVPAESRVFLMLPPNIAAGVAQRLQRPGVTFVLPPAATW